MILYAELQTYQSFSPFSMMDSAGWKQENLRLSKTVIQLYYEDDFYHQDQYEMLILGAIQETKLPGCFTTKIKS